MNTQTQEKPLKLRLSDLLNASRPTLSQAVETFLYTGFSGKSDQTVLWYRKKLKGLLNAIGSELPIDSISELELMDWIADLEKRSTKYGGKCLRPEENGKLTPETIHGYIRSTRYFFKWLFQHNIIQGNPAEHLPLPKLPKRGKSGISETNLHSILENANDNTRDYAILYFLESTGCREGGVAHLLLSDLNLDNPNKRLRRRVTVREKGNKERTVILTESAIEALQGWLSIRPDIADDHVFLGKANGSLDWKPFRESGIAAMVTKYKKILKLQGKCSPHQWRHRWARQHLLEGMDLSIVSQLLGHEGVDITVRFYGQFNVDQLQDAFDRFTADHHSEEPFTDR